MGACATAPVHDMSPARSDYASVHAPYQTHTHALLRTVAGFLFLGHGMSKLLGIPTPPPPRAPPFVIYVGGGVELVTGALAMLGLFAPWAAFLASGEMAVA